MSVHLLAAQSATSLAAQWKTYDAARRQALAANTRCWCMRWIAPWWQQQRCRVAGTNARRRYPEPHSCRLPGRPCARTVDPATAGWRAPQRTARKRILTEMGVCASSYKTGCSTQQTGGLWAAI